MATEMKRLRWETETLRYERDILKKATATSALSVSMVSLVSISYAWIDEKVDRIRALDAADAAGGENVEALAKFRS